MRLRFLGEKRELPDRVAIHVFWSKKIFVCILMYLTINDANMSLSTVLYLYIYTHKHMIVLSTVGFTVLIFHITTNMCHRISEFFKNNSAAILVSFVVNVQVQNCKKCFFFKWYLYPTMQSVENIFAYRCMNMVFFSGSQ